MTIFQTNRARSLSNPSQIFAVHRKIDVFGQACRERIAGLNVEKHREASHNPIRDARRLEGATSTLGDLGQLFQVTIVCLKQQCSFTVARCALP